MILSESNVESFDNTPLDQISLEEENDIAKFSLVLKNYLKSQNIEISSQQLNSAGKLFKLSIRHLMELACDICDEIDRREKKYFTRLSHKSNLGSKRNNARSKMADFTEEKLSNLIVDMVLEIKRRNLPFLSLDVREESYCNFENISKSNDLSSPIISKKSRLHSADILKSNRSFTSKNIDLSYAEIYTGIDSISAFIEDIGFMIENEDDTTGELKQKYELEIIKYRQSIENYENVIIPEKNREISALMTRLEEGDLLNSKMKKEIEELNEQLKSFARIIEDQKSAYDTIKAALNSNQIDFNNRSDQLTANARNKALREIIDANLFSLLAEHFSFISSAIEGLENNLSSFNQKSCLKLLRDIATSGKFVIVNVDRILRVASLFDLSEILLKGNRTKSSFMSNLSSVLVSGKDYSIRPTYSVDFKTCLQNFKSSNEELLSLRVEIETILKKH